MSDGYKAHLFVCTNSPDRKGKCGNLHAEDLRKDLKQMCREEFGKTVRVSSSGCMGYCERGIVAVIYPQNKWLFDLHKKDADDVMEQVRQALKSAGI